MRTRRLPPKQHDELLIDRIPGMQDSRCICHERPRSSSGKCMYLICPRSDIVIRSLPHTLSPTIAEKTGLPTGRVKTRRWGRMGSPDPIRPDSTRTVIFQIPPDGTGPDWTGPDRTGPDPTRPDTTRPVSFRRHHDPTRGWAHNA